MLTRLSSYWEHLVLSGLFARAIAEAAPQGGLNPSLAESVGLLHHFGLLISEKRDAVITDVFFTRAQVRKEFLFALPPKRHILGLSGSLDLPGKMTDAQRMTYMAEVLARKNPDGSLPREDSIVQWLDKLYEKRPEQVTGIFVSEMRMSYLKVNTDLLKQIGDFSKVEIKWFRERLGISIDDIIARVEERFNQAGTKEFLKKFEKPQSRPC